MTLIKNILKTALISTLLSANAYSSDLLVDDVTAIDDSYDDVSRRNDDSIFNIEKMDISSIANKITVNVYTNFVQYNDEEIYFGDLLISTGAEGSAYDYAFVLGDGRDDDYSLSRSELRSWNNDTETTVMDGTLTEVESTTSSTCTTTTTTGHCRSSTTTTTTTTDDDVIVMASGTSVSDGNDTWTVTNNDSRRYTDIISFSFNVGHLDDFLDASQLAFSWTMSCANDVVEGFAVVNPRTSVPEPATILLMLGALAFMANSRKKLND